MKSKNTINQYAVGNINDNPEEISKIGTMNWRS